MDGARSAGAEYVIVVGHLGNEGVHQQWSSEAVIANTTGIDAFIDGHSHETYTKSYNSRDGGDGMNMFMGTNIIRDEVSTDVDMLSAYINENLGGTVGAEYADHHGQGRITIK